MVFLDRYGTKVFKKYLLVNGDDVTLWQQALVVGHDLKVFLNYLRLIYFSSTKPVAYKRKGTNKTLFEMFQKSIETFALYWSAYCLWIGSGCGGCGKSTNNISTDWQAFQIRCIHLFRWWHDGSWRLSVIFAYWWSGGHKSVLKINDLEIEMDDL